jgi:hypothetical protein
MLAGHRFEADTGGAADMNMVRVSRTLSLWALVLGLPGITAAPAQPSGGLPLPIPDLTVSVGTDGAVLVKNVGDWTADVPAFNLQLTCKVLQRGGTRTVNSLCGPPFQANSYNKPIQNWKKGAPNPVNPCAGSTQNIAVYYPGAVVVCLPVATWPNGTYAVTATVDNTNLVAEKSEGNNGASAQITVNNPTPTAVPARKAATPRTRTSS